MKKKRREKQEKKSKFQQLFVFVIKLVLILCNLQCDVYIKILCKMNGNDSNARMECMFMCIYVFMSVVDKTRPFSQTWRVSS